jgi:hypothetical protein
MPRSWSKGSVSCNNGGGTVDVLLVVREPIKRNLMFIVQLQSEGLSKEVEGLLGKNRCRDAFELVKAKGEVKRFIPEGEKLSVQPDLVLIEDLL